MHHHKKVAKFVDFIQNILSEKWWIIVNRPHKSPHVNVMDKYLSSSLSKLTSAVQGIKNIVLTFKEEELWIVTKRAFQSYERMKLFQEFVLNNQLNCL